MMKFYDIKAAFTSLNLAYERLINFQQFSELFLCYPPHFALAAQATNDLVI